MKTTGTPWPHVLADLRAKHQALGDIITIVETHFVDDASPGEIPASPATAKLKKRATRPKPTTTRGPEQTDHTAEVVAAIKKAGGSMAPGELAKILKVDRVTVRKWVSRMVTAKTVVATGSTLNRRFSLPGRGPKEVP